ncbi:MAG: DUF4263 domain-containing protein [Clostridia bacterium]|nr:DUF4263 domain-containing protein [Clostridia bacterium]
MRLFQRDYNVLTPEERAEWAKLDHEARLDENGEVMPMGIRKTNFKQLPKAVRHHKGLFPNNYLDIEGLKQVKELEIQIDRFELLLNDGSTSERTILNYINQGNYHLIASILRGYNFGHHNAYMFKEFPLGSSHRPDYLLIGKNSGGYELIFVELESNKGSVTLQDGEFGDVIRKGIRQVEDWNVWLQANYSNLSEYLNRLKKEADSLPTELYTYDSTRIHFVVVAGRRYDYNDLTYSRRRRLKDTNKINVLHYDNLIDLAKSAIGESTY